MGNLKQRLIKPGTDFNYAEGVKVKASSAIFADQIVYVTGSEGPYLKAAPADADDMTKTVGRLMIAKHAIPADGFGVVLPWKLITSVDTSSGAVGAPVYLADSISAATAGNLSLTAPTGDAKVIIVGRITIAATVANGGTIMVHADAPEERVKGGGYSANATSGVAGSPTEVFRYSLADATAVELTMDYPVIVLDAFVFSAGTTSSTVKLYKGDATGSEIFSVTKGTTANKIVRAGTSTDMAHASIPKGTKLTAKKSSAAEAGDLMVVTVIRA